MVLLLALNVLELTYDMPAIQPSLRDLGNAKLAPALKRRAIFRQSLRDEGVEILVTFDRNSTHAPINVVCARWRPRSELFELHPSNALFSLLSGMQVAALLLWAPFLR